MAILASEYNEKVAREKVRHLQNKYGMHFTSELSVNVGIIWEDAMCDPTREKCVTVANALEEFCIKNWGQ